MKRIAHILTLALIAAATTVITARPARAIDIPCCDCPFWPPCDTGTGGGEH